MSSASSSSEEVLELSEVRIMEGEREREWAEDVAEVCDDAGEGERVGETVEGVVRRKGPFIRCFCPLKVDSSSEYIIS